MDGWLFRFVAVWKNASAFGEEMLVSLYLFSEGNAMSLIYSFYKNLSKIWSFSFVEPLARPHPPFLHLNPDSIRSVTGSMPPVVLSFFPPLFRFLASSWVKRVPKSVGWFCFHGERCCCC